MSEGAVFADLVVALRGAVEKTLTAHGGVMVEGSVALRMVISALAFTAGEMANAASPSRQEFRATVRWAQEEMASAADFARKERPEAAATFVRKQRGRLQ